MNKKTILILIILSTYSLTIQAQSKHTISLSLGASIPVGDFGLKEYNNQNSKYANMGQNVNLNYAYRVHKYLSVRAMVDFMNNSVDANKILSDVNAQSGNYLTSLTIPPTLKFSFLLGFEGNIPLSTKLSLNPYILMGLSQVFKPENRFSTITNEWGVNESKWSNCFTYQVGWGVQYLLSNKLFLLAKLDYNHSSVEFKDIKSYGSSGSSTYSTKINITTFNPSLGLGYKF